MRDFEASDQHAARELVLAGLRERWGSAFQEEGFNQDLDDIWVSYIEEAAEVVVIDGDDQLAAIGMLIPEAPGEGRIVRMSVSRDHRRQGLAREIVDELLRRARAAGLTAVHVATDTPWLSAVALYEACGFVETHRDDTDTHFILRLPLRCLTPEGA